MTKFIYPPSLLDEYRSTKGFFQNLLYKITGKESVKPIYTYLGIEYTLRIITKDVNHQRDITWINEWNDDPFSHILPQYLRYETNEQVNRVKKAGGFYAESNLFVPYHEILSIEVKDVKKFYRQGISEGYENKNLGPRVYVEEWPELE